MTGISRGDLFWYDPQNDASPSCDEIDRLKVYATVRRPEGSFFDWRINFGSVMIYAEKIESGQLASADYLRK